MLRLAHERVQKSLHAVARVLVVLAVLHRPCWVSCRSLVVLHLHKRAVTSLCIIASMTGRLQQSSLPAPYLHCTHVSGLCVCREVNIPMTLPQRDISTFASMPPLGRIVAKFIEQDPANRQPVVEIVQKCAADNGCLRQDGAIHMTENLIHFISARKPVRA